MIMIISNTAGETSTQEQKVSDSFGIMKGQFWDELDIFIIGRYDFLMTWQKNVFVSVCICPFVLADSDSKVTIKGTVQCSST